MNYSIPGHATNPFEIRGSVRDCPFRADVSSGSDRVLRSPSLSRSLALPLAFSHSLPLPRSLSPARERALSLWQQQQCPGPSKPANGWRWMVHVLGFGVSLLPIAPHPEPAGTARAVLPVTVLGFFGEGGGGVLIPKP